MSTDTALQSPPNMSESQLNAPGLSSDYTLRSAWIHFLQFDTAANKQKYKHVRIRTVVLMLAFLTSFISIIFTSNTIIALLVSSVLGAGFTELVRFALFLFPLISTGIMAYATQFIPSQSWAKYRYSAELIRREIFLYRTEAGDYFSKSAEENQKSLSAALTKAGNFSGLNITTDELPLPDDENLVKQIQSVSIDKNGFGKLDFDTYVTKRLIEQKKWYQDKSYGDYRKMQRWQLANLIIVAAGSLLTFLHFEAWVALTTTAVFTVTALATLMMYGRTYNIYLKAAQDVELHYREWNIHDQAFRNIPKNQADFIEKAEGIFGNEIDVWMSQTRDLLTQSDNTMSQALGGAPPDKGSASAAPADSKWAGEDTQEPPAVGLADAEDDLAVINTPAPPITDNTSENDKEPKQEEKETLPA